MDRSKLRLILVQCESGDQKGNLVACARYSIESEIKTLKKIDIKNLFVILIVQIPRVTGRYFTGFQCGTWHSVHIDELRAKDGMPHFIDMYKKPISAVLESYLHETETSGAQFDVISLIWSCIQKALASVKDVNEESKRNIERVKLMFSLEERYGKLCTSKEGEPGRNQKSVMSGLAVHIIALLKEKEEYFDQHRWLSTETAKSIDIDRAGTYR
ncbi:Hypothetical predicted protein [Mytilus galloprovincialis]|uniref:Uncharacterized protein n=1 Tax=Mytilus galloprovincialis TaxID=29158 RepID=A0A8B6EK21_MYTGA|nr:Hypothetical predicted protein [Mytilus galloprovincialis]